MFCVAVSSVADSKTSSKSSSKSVYARSYVDSSYFEPRDDRPLDDRGFDDREDDPPENETESPRSVRRFGILGRTGEAPDIEFRLNLTSWLYHLFRISRFSNLNNNVEHLSVHMIPTAPPNLTRLSLTISPN